MLLGLARVKLGLPHCYANLPKNVYILCIDKRCNNTYSCKNIFTEMPYEKKGINSPRPWAERDSPQKPRWIYQWYHSIVLPSRNQHFALVLNFLRPPLINFHEIIQHKIALKFWKCRHYFKKRFKSYVSCFKIRQQFVRPRRSFLGPFWVLWPKNRPAPISTRTGTGQVRPRRKEILSLKRTAAFGKKN